MATPSKFVGNLKWFLLMGFAFVFILGVADWFMIQYIYGVGWGHGEQAIQTGFWLMGWFSILLFSLAYYLASKDWSETVALFVGVGLMVLSGLEDVAFYLTRYFATGVWFDNQMCWLGFPQNFVSSLIGEACVTPLTLFANVILGGVVAYFAYEFLIRQPW